MFFNDKQYAQVTAIFDQLIPEDDLSPSALKQGCVGFIDHQLAGSYGKVASLYMQGPFLQERHHRVINHISITSNII